MKAGIIGLGLIGGSMGLALKKLDEISSISGFDANPTHAQMALNLGLCDEIFSIDEIFKTCDVIFLATPVESIVQMVKNLKRENLKQGATIIDLGSTKLRISESIPNEIRQNFVCAHPMSGTEFYGPKAALDGLFKDKIVILCDLEKSADSQAQIARDLFIKIGMNIKKMSSEQHDLHTAFVSHMPHILSFALANCVLQREQAQVILALAGGGFKSMSRLSKSSPKMWGDICKQNRENVLNAIDEFSAQLAQAREFLEHCDWENLEAFMQNANKMQELL